MKLLKLASVALVLFALTACNRNQKKVIAVIPKGSAHLFWQSVHAGANKAAQEDGVEIAWNGPAAETDFNVQLQIMDSMITRHVDAIALAPIDKQSMVSVVDRAAAQNIPVVIFDSGIDTDKFVAQVATDNFRAGEVAAERMGQLLGGKGKIAMVMVQPGAASTMAREDGFQKKIAAAFPGIQIVDKQYGWADFAKSLNVSENMLTAHPDLDAMFSSNESSTVGAVQALKGRKGTKVKLVGFDWSPTLLDDLKSGLIDSLVVQDPFRMGYDSVKSAVAKLNGRPVEKIQNLPPKLVTLENLNTPEVQAQINPDLKKYLQ
jgi:ribose transport system substrate-binding protein